MADALVENPRAFAAKVAGALGGSTVDGAELSGFVSSSFDAFLNHLFAGPHVTLEEMCEALAGRPGFVWVYEHPTETPAGANVIVMQGMSAELEAEVPQSTADITQVRSTADLDAWHAVYCEVFGADARSRDEWRRVHKALGASGDGSLTLLLARIDGEPAATGGAFFDAGVAGLYCFTTRASMRGRGLATALVHAAHAAAQKTGVERAILQATPAGRSVYARIGYADERPLPVLAFRGG